jgi:hypothetical protein
MLVEARIPMRQDDDGGFAFKGASRATAVARRVKGRVDGVVLFVAGVNRRGEADLVAFQQLKIGGALVVEEMI